MKRLSFDEDQTMSEFIEDLMDEFTYGDKAVQAFAVLEGKFEGFSLKIKLEKTEGQYES